MENADRITADVPKKEPWSYKKKIVMVVIGIAIIVLAAAFIARFVFGIDLLNLSSYAMKLKRIGC